MIKIKKFTKSYGANPVFNEFDLEIPKGRIIGLLGPNGSGKTTLIKTLAGLLSPNSGDITIDDLNIGVESKKIVSFLPDNHFLDNTYKIIELVNFYNDFFPDFNKDKAIDLMKSMSIDLNVKLKTLSKGNIEKVKLILTISREAKYFLLDEPIGGVDPSMRKFIIDTILTSLKEDTTIIISTHLVTDIEPILTDIILIHNGKLILDGNVEDLKKQYNKSINDIFQEVVPC